MAAIVRRPGTVYSALVPNDKGAVRAVDARVDEIHTVVSASESHNLANVNMTIAESLAKLARGGRGRAGARRCRWSPASPARSAARSRATCRSTTWSRWWRASSTSAPAASAWPTPPAWPIRRRSRACSSAWCRASPASSGRSTPTTRGRWRSPTSWPPWSTGVTHFDASIGGLGGCPFAPGASGNVCTEDLIHCLHAMGVETGVDLDALIAVSKRVQEIVGRAAARPARQGRQVGPALSPARRRARADSRPAHDQDAPTARMLRLMDRAVTPLAHPGHRPGEGPRAAPPAAPSTSRGAASRSARSSATRRSWWPATCHGAGA